MYVLIGSSFWREDSKLETTLLGLASRRYAKKVQRQGLVATLQTDWTEPFNSQSVERIRQDVGFFCLFVCYSFHYYY